MVCPELTLEVSSLVSDWHRLPWPHEEMKDLAMYIKVAHSAIHEVPSGMLVLTLNLKQTAKLASRLLLALRSNGEKYLEILKASAVSSSSLTDS